MEIQVHKKSSTLNNLVAMVTLDYKAFHYSGQKHFRGHHS